MFAKGQSGNPAGKKKGTKNKTKFINVVERLRDLDEEFCIIKYVLDIALGNNADLDSSSCRLQAIKMLYEKSTVTPKDEVEDSVSLTTEQLLKVIGDK